MCSVHLWTRGGSCHGNYRIWCASVLVQGFVALASGAGRSSHGVVSVADVDVLVPSGRSFAMVWSLLDCTDGFVLC